MEFAYNFLTTNSITEPGLLNIKQDLHVNKIDLKSSANHVFYFSFSLKRHSTLFHHITLDCMPDSIFIYS